MLPTGPDEEKRKSDILLSVFGITQSDLVNIYQNTPALDEMMDYFELCHNMGQKIDYIHALGLMLGEPDDQRNQAFRNLFQKILVSTRTNQNENSVLEEAYAYLLAHDKGKPGFNDADAAAHYAEELMRFTQQIFDDLLPTSLPTRGEQFSAVPTKLIVQLDDAEINFIEEQFFPEGKQPTAIEKYQNLMLDSGDFPDIAIYVKQFIVDAKLEEKQQVLEKYLEQMRDSTRDIDLTLRSSARKAAEEINMALIKKIFPERAKKIETQLEKNKAKPFHGSTTFQPSSQPPQTTSSASSTTITSTNTFNPPLTIVEKIKNEMANFNDANKAASFIKNIINKLTNNDLICDVILDIHPDSRKKNSAYEFLHSGKGLRSHSDAYKEILDCAKKKILANAKIHQQMPSASEQEKVKNVLFLTTHRVSIHRSAELDQYNNILSNLSQQPATEKKPQRKS